MDNIWIYIYSIAGRHPVAIPATRIVKINGRVESVSSKSRTNNWNKDASVFLFLKSNRKLIHQLPDLFRVNVRPSRLLRNLHYFIFNIHSFTSFSITSFSYRLFSSFRYSWSNGMINEKDDDSSSKIKVFNLINEKIAYEKLLRMTGMENQTTSNQEKTPTEIYLIFAIVI